MLKSGAELERPGGSFSMALASVLFVRSIRAQRAHCYYQAARNRSEAICKTIVSGTIYFVVAFLTIKRVPQ